MKRFFLVLTLVLGLLPSLALAQTEAGMDIVKVDPIRYAEDGQTSVVVEFRNLEETLDPALISVTTNGQEVSNLVVEPLASSLEPVGIVLVIDVSGSMQGAPMEAAKVAAANFVNQKRPGDFIAIVTFADTAQTVAGFTNTAADLVARIEALEPAGETAFNDGVIQAVNLFDQVQAQTLRRNIIVLSDGADTASVATTEDVLGAINNPENPVRIFGVALESPEFAPDAIRQVAEAGDGLFLSTTDPEQLSGLYEQIQREINNLLVLRFNSPINTAGPVEFLITYGDLNAVTTEPVPGWATTSTAGPATTTTFAAAEPFTIESRLPASPTAMIGISALGLGLAIGLFIFILFGRGNEDAGAVFKRRLEAYGKRGAEEKRSVFERLPILRLFSQRAEEEVRRRGLLSGVNSALEQANIPLSAGEAIAGAFGLSVVFGILTALFTRNPISGGIAFGFAVLLVVFILNFLGKREKRRFENQLPDTLTLISTSLRAGYSLLQAVEAVASEAPNPTAREFGRAIAEARLGRPVVQALQGITTRTQSQDFEWAVMAVEIQREVGGNLAEVLQTVAETMRQRNRLKGEIRALTAEGRISAIVLGALPFVMALFLYTSNRPYIMILFANTYGIIAVIAGVVMMLAGIYWLRRIVNIEV